MVVVPPLFNYPPIGARTRIDVNDPHTFMDLYVSTTDPILRMRSCAYYPRYGFGAFGVFPVLSKKREPSEDHGLMGLRYGSENLSIGVTLMPPALMPFASGKEKLSNLMNWSCAMGYGGGLGSPLSPSFNFSLELVRSSQVKNPLEENVVVGITNYIDFGFELETSVDDAIATNNIKDSSFRIGASWQANKNFLLKGEPQHNQRVIRLYDLEVTWICCFSTATRDHADGKMQCGFGIQSESLREASYERADPNFVMVTPSKEHLAEGIAWETGKRPMLQSDVDAGLFDGLPKELRPLDKIL
ncbi:hypothetical protein TanjilG_04149 [Lupinus angustifolius]|uniref:Uncharacterized protein n=1 Tax=Lupinus angustifolius TaxID=3871 RepID=A0A4P1RJC9_LUPAN|nr:hypothetical protein TanjilG_04149 [Lupinus angustifolius]